MLCINASYRAYTTGKYYQSYTTLSCIHVFVVVIYSWQVCGVSLMINIKG